MRWYGGLAKGWLYGAGEFLSVGDYRTVQRWADAIAARPAGENFSLLGALISWMPMLLIIGIWLFVMRQMQGGAGGKAMGFGKSKAKLLTDAQYHHLQTLGEFDTRTSSWLLTPADVRNRGGALFGDRRFGRVFIYHNGADSYYAARGFRAAVRV